MTNEKSDRQAADEPGEPRGSQSNSPIDGQQAPGNQPPSFVRIRGLASMASEYREGDGVDPKEEKRQKLRGRQKHKSDHASERLAKQIFDALCLSSLLHEIGMSDFSVAAVHPTGRGGSYLVEIESRLAGPAYDAAEVEGKLRAASGKFREEVSSFVHRRKAPELKFRVRPPAANL